GRAFVSLEGQNGQSIDIVSEDTVNELSMTVEDGTEGKKHQISVITDEGSQSVEIKTGAIKGLQEAQVVVDEKQDEVNTFIKNLTDAVNLIHKGGKAGEGIEFFVEDEEGKFIVNPTLIKNPSLINAGKIIEGEAVAGDGTRAKAIFDLQNTMLDFSNNEWLESYDDTTMSFTSNPKGSTVINHFNEIVTDMGISKQQSDNMLANQLDLTILLEQRRDSISGVDMNEEIVNMIQYQSAFQANSRVISTITEMLDTIINRMGV